MRRRRGIDETRTLRQRCGRFAIAAALATVTLALGVWFALPLYVEHRVERALHEAGFPAAEVTVGRVGLSSMEIAPLYLGPDARADRVEVAYHLRAVLAGGRVDRVRVVGADVTVRLDQAAPVAIPSADRLMARAGRIELMGGRIRLVHGPLELLATLDGRIDPLPDGLALSAVGKLAGVPVSAKASLGPDGAWSFRARGSARSLEARVAGTLGRVDDVTIDLLGNGSGEVRRNVSLRARAGSLVVDRSALGEVDLTAAIDGDGAAALVSLPALGVHALLGGALPAEASEVAFVWRLWARPRGPAPGVLASLGLALEAPSLEAAGRAVWSGGEAPRLELDRADVRIQARRARMAGAAVEAPSLRLVATASIDGRGGFTRLVETGAASARAVRIGDTRLDDLRATVDGGADGLLCTVERGGPVRVTATIKADAPVAPAGWARLAPSSAALSLSAELGERSWFVGRVDAGWRRVLLAGGFALADAHLRLRLGAGARARRTRGELRGALTWRGKGLGVLRADVALLGRHVEAQGEATLATGARVSLRGEVSMARGGARGSVELALVEGAVSLGAASIEAGAATVSFVGGQAVADLRLHAGGAEVWADDVRWAPGRPTTLTAHVRHLALDQALRLAARGRVEGRGFLDGDVTVRLDPGWPPALHLVSGHLAATGPGRIAVRDRTLATTVAHHAAGPSGDVVAAVRGRITGALADFGYTRLRVDLAPQAGRLILTAAVAGTGRRVPQELSFVIRARGFDRLADRMLDLRRPLSFHLTPLAKRRPPP